MEIGLNYKRKLKKNWLVIYVRPRWEKKVDRLLQDQGIETFCPLKTTENQWADRKKTVSVPLFTGYVFVRIDDRDLTKVRYTLGVVNYIYFMGKPAILREATIEQLKEMVKTYNNLEIINLNDLSTGDRVRIRSGLFYNQEGKIIKIQGKTVLMSFDHIDCALVTRVEISQLIKAKPLNNALCTR
ncbi:MULTISPECIES: UpxY family transcription antiterminator [Sphingobacterium]|uniref:UpxY family transcription antiterminator n=1 Tax=Sphingobacterium TaxID=28453 RepID=UPI0013DD32D2|nr:MULTISPECIES: UpxY family transcription antiterminator [unclassified Sphingobacterium]